MILTGSEPMRRRAPFAVLILALVLAAAPSPGRGEIFAPDARTFNLDNGMQVVVIPDHRAPIVTHMVWYRVGAADEPAGKTGVAHFLEHLLFKGTEKYPEGAFSRLVAERGGQENAFTSSDYTAYFQRVAREHLGLVMELEADRMANLVLSEKTILAERDVVMEERRSRTDNDPGSQLAEEVEAALYRVHPYGRPVIGWAHEIMALNHADALDFYRRHYSPNNAILVVAGDIDVDQVRTLAAKTYGRLARRAELPPRVRPAEPPQRAGRRVVLSDERVEQPMLRRIYDVPSYHTASDREAAALDVLAELLGGGSTSRLYRRLVVEGGLATSAGAYYSGRAFDGGQFGVYGVPRDTVSLPALEAAIDETIAALLAGEIGAAELDRVKTGLIAGAVYAQDSQFALARVFGEALTTGATVADVQTWPDRVAAVTAEDVRAVARAYLRPERAVTGYLERAESGGKDGRS